MGQFIPYAQYVTLLGIEFYSPNLVVLNHRTTLKQITYIESASAFSFLVEKCGALLCGRDIKLTECSRFFFLSFFSYIFMAKIALSGKAFLFFRWLFTIYIVEFPSVKDFQEVLFLYNSRLHHI